MCLAVVRNKNARAKTLLAGHLFPGRLTMILHAHTILQTTRSNHRSTFSPRARTTRVSCSYTTPAQSYFFRLVSTCFFSKHTYTSSEGFSSEERARNIITADGDVPGNFLRESMCSGVELYELNPGRVIWFLEIHKFSREYIKFDILLHSKRQRSFNVFPANRSNLLEKYVFIYDELPFINFTSFAIPTYTADNCYGAHWRN